RPLRLSRLDEDAPNGRTGGFARPHRGDLLRRVLGSGGARSRLCRGFASGNRRQFRPHRRGQYRRSAGDRGKNTVLGGAAHHAAGARTQGGGEAHRFAEDGGDVRETGHRRIAGRLVIATHNSGKLVEMRELLAPYGVDATSAGELGLEEPEELGVTFRDNAHIKAEAAAKATGVPALADDSGLVVDALDDAPGIHSARWTGAEFWPGHGDDRGKTAPARRDDAAAPQGAFRLRALCGLAGWSCGGIRGPGHRHTCLAAAGR